MPAVPAKLALVSSLYFRPAPLAVPYEQADVAEETPTQQQARMSASSATRELDELMASLSDFKVQSNVSQFILHIPLMAVVDLNVHLFLK